MLRKPWTSLLVTTWAVFVTGFVLTRGPGNPNLLLVFVVGGMVLGWAFGAWSLKSELDTSFWRASWAMARMGRIWVFFLAIFVLTFVSFHVLLTSSRWGIERPLMAFGAAAVTAGFLLIRALPALRDRGIDREVFLKSTSLAFFVTMVFALAAAGVEGFTDNEGLSVWAVWIVGMLTWAVSATVVARRLTR